MIVAVNPHPGDFDEARQALKYGAIAQDISVRKTMNTRKAPVPRKIKSTDKPVPQEVWTLVEDWGEV